MRRRTRSVVTAAVVLAAATALGCNAILGADDYKVGQGSDGGSVGPGDTGGTGNDTGGTGNDTGGAGNDTGGAGNDTGGRGSGGKGAGGSPNAGGSNPGTGGRGTGGRVGTGGTTPGTGGASTGVNAFIGSWTTDAETTTVTCSDGMPPTTDVGPDQLDWTEGTAAGTIETYVPVADCIAVADVSGKVATLPKMSCTDSMGITYALNGTFTIQADGTARLLETLTLSMNGFMCTIDASGVFTKLPAL